MKKRLKLNKLVEKHFLRSDFEYGRDFSDWLTLLTSEGPSMLTIDALKAETAVPVIIVDHEGTILYINQVFEETWGWKKGTLVGQTLTKIIPGNLRDAHQMGFSRFLLTGKPTILNQGLELAIVIANGEEAVAEHHIIAEKTDGNWAFGATIKPLEDHGGNS